MYKRSVIHRSKRVQWSHSRSVTLTEEKPRLLTSRRGRISTATLHCEVSRSVNELIAVQRWLRITCEFNRFSSIGAWELLSTQIDEPTDRYLEIARHSTRYFLMTRTKSSSQYKVRCNQMIDTRHLWSSKIDVDVMLLLCCFVMHPQLSTECRVWIDLPLHFSNPIEFNCEPFSNSGDDS